MATYRPLEPKEDQYTRVDNYLFDHIMPATPPNAWKILCLIVRKTRGWVDRETGERKSRDRISYSQIMEGTGIKHPKTVSSAIQFLVNAKYILAMGSQGDWEAIEYELNTAFEVELPTSKNEATSKSEVGITSKNEVAPTSKNEDTKESSKERKEKDSHAEKSDEDFSRASVDSIPHEQPSLLPSFVGEHKANIGSESSDKENHPKQDNRAGKRSKKAPNPNTIPIMEAYIGALGYQPANYAKEAKSAKALAEQGYTPKQVATAYTLMKADKWWEGKHIPLASIHENIGALLPAINRLIAVNSTKPQQQYQGPFLRV